MSSWSSENGAPARNSPSRVPTRETCVSTGTSRIPKLNSSTHAAVLRPTPGSASSSARAASTLSVARWSSDGGSGSSHRIAWIRSDLTLEMPPGRIAASTSSSGASRTAVQLGKRARSRWKATSRLRSFVDCDSTVRISSSSGRRCGSATGRP